MGLQAWYPLINDMHNQGVGDTDLVVETTPAFGAGKMGNALISGGNSHWTAAQSEKVLNNNAISICFWVYVDAPEGDTNKRAMFFGNNGKRNYSLFQYPSCNDFHWSWYSYDSSSTGTFITGGALTGVLPSYKWTHVAITYSNPNGVVYINGENKKTFSGVMNNYTFSNQTPVIYQCEYRKLNDFRIYDHALSPREVKEISKGLVLHYPLAMPGGENIIANTSHEIACTYPASGVKDYYFVKTKSVPNETQYTLSFEAKSTVDGDHLRTHFYSPNTTTTCESSQGIIKTASDGNMDFTLTTEWKRYWVVYTQTETTAIKSVICPRLCSPASYPSSQSGTGTVYVRNQKLERGSHPTPWIPYPADAEYSALGFDDGIEYDVSGYGNNGTKVGSIAYDADTPRYETGAVFDGTTYVINNTSTVHLSNEFTISWWGKINTWIKKWEGMFLLQNTTALNAASGTYSVASAIHASKDNMMTLTFRQGGTSYPFDHYEWTYTIGTWAHYACTYKDGVVIMYQNGAQVYTATIDNSSSGDYYYTIGRRGSNCICQLSDFRIYNTALSADDILELYHTSETLSNNGTLLTQGEFEES